MNLMDYLRLLLRRGWIILLLAGITAGSAYLFTRTQTPIYKSTQLVLMQPSRPDLGVSEAIIRILNNYAVWLRSSLQAGKVIDTLQLDMTPQQLQGQVTVDADTLRLYIQIDVEDSSEVQANRIAAAYGELLREYQIERNQRARNEDRIDAVIQDNPVASLSRPRTLVTTAAGGVLGLLVGAIIVFILEFLESNLIRRREDLEPGMSFPVLAAVPATPTETITRGA